MSKLSEGVLPRILVPSYRLQPPGVDRLAELPMTINGLTPDPVCRYKGGDAGGTNWPAWGYGETLTLQAGTAPSYNQGSPFPGANNDSVKFNAGGFYKAATEALTEIGTKDILVEGIFYSSPGDTRGLLGNYAGGPGLSMLSLSNGGFYCKIKSAVDGGELYSVNATLNCWQHILVFMNRTENSTNSQKIYANAYPNSALTSCYLARDSAISGQRFSIGAQPQGASTPCSTTVAYVALYLVQDWFPDGAAAVTEWQNVANIRFHALMGARPKFSIPTNTVFPTMRASTAACLQKRVTAGVTKFFRMGPNTVPVDTVVDALGNTFSGTGGVQPATNKLYPSETLSTWTKLNANDVITDALSAGPTRELTLSGIKGSSDTGVLHGVATATATLAATEHSYSVYAKKGNKDWLYIANTTVANCYAYFNLNTGAVGTKGAGATTAKIEAQGDGLYRCWITFTGTAAAHTCQIVAAEGDTDTDFAGDGATVNVYAGCAQVDVWDYPSAYIQTTTGAGLRNRDCPYYALPGLSNTEGALFLRFVYPAVTTNYIKYLAALSVNALTTNAVNVWISTSGRVNVSTTSTDGGGDAGSVAETSGNRRDNIIHSVLVTWAHNNLKLYVDGVLIATDTVVDPPVGLNRLTVADEIVPSAYEAWPVIVGDVQVFNTSDISKLKIVY